jgi:glutathione S-transferase
MTDVVLYHHPFSRAAGALWVLEEIGCPYRLEHVELTKGEQKSERIRALNPMGKIPILVDGEQVVTETSAIAMYLADRYAPGRLAPALNSKDRGKYLRACVFPASVIEPACLAKQKGWEVPTGQAGFGEYDAMVASVEALIGEGPFVLGQTFSIADTLLGGTVRWMLRFEMLPATETLTAYAKRLGERPALQAADAKNSAIIAERGLGR